MYLKRMGAKEPCVAYIRGAIAEVRVGAVSEDIKSCLHRSQRCFPALSNRPAPDMMILLCLQVSICWFLSLRHASDDGKWVRKPEGMAAALELCISELMDNVNLLLKKDLEDIRCFSGHYQQIL